MNQKLSRCLANSLNFFQKTIAITSIKAGSANHKSFGGLVIKSASMPETPTISVKVSQPKMINMVSKSLRFFSAWLRLALLQHTYTAIIITNAMANTIAIKKAEIWSGMPSIYIFTNFRKLYGIIKKYLYYNHQFSAIQPNISNYLGFKFPFSIKTCDFAKQAAT